MQKLGIEADKFNEDITYMQGYILSKNTGTVPIHCTKKNVHKLLPTSTMVDVTPNLLHRNAFAKQWGDSMKLDYTSAQQDQRQKDDFKKYSTDPSKYNFPTPTNTSKKTPAKPGKPP